MGTYDTKIEAQNKAIIYILGKYESLPSDGYHKVVYSFRDNLMGEPSKNALWYNKRDIKLGLEVDVNSGIACSWKEVSKSVLEQASKSKNGMVEIDSLSNRDQPTAQCL